MQITSSGHLTLGPDSHSDISVQSSHLSYAPCVLNLYFNSKSKSVFHFSRSNDWSKSDHGAMIASLSSSHHDVTPWWPDLMMIETLTCVVAGVVCCCLLLSAVVSRQPFTIHHRPGAHISGVWSWADWILIIIRTRAPANRDWKIVRMLFVCFHCSEPRHYLCQYIMLCVLTSSYLLMLCSEKSITCNDENFYIDGEIFLFSEDAILLFAIIQSQIWS